MYKPALQVGVLGENKIVVEEEQSGWEEDINIVAMILMVDTMD